MSIFSSPEEWIQLLVIQQERALRAADLGWLSQFVGVTAIQRATWQRSSLPSGDQL
jgi:hypothetical protein